jgi:hypothetical protein
MSSPALTIKAVSELKAKQGSPTALLYQILTGGAQLSNGQTLTSTAFFEEWTRGGKQQFETLWRDHAGARTGHMIPKEDLDPSADEGDDDPEYVDERFTGKHEWIPTNMVGYVIEHASRLSDLPAITWLQLAEVLRTPTRWVIHKPYPSGERLTGHVGALYKNGKALTKGQKAFHDDLRQILRENLTNSKSDPESFCAQLIQYIETNCWQGTAVTGFKDSDACPYSYNDSGQVRWGLTVEEMRKAVHDNVPFQIDILKNVSKQVTSQLKPSVTFPWSATFLAKGGSFPGDDGDHGMDGSKPSGTGSMSD